MLNKLTKLIPIQYTTLDASIKGRSFGVLIQIDKKYKDDKGLLAHERVHAKQFLRLWLSAIPIGLVLLFLGYDFGIIPIIAGIGLHGLLYKFSKVYRYKAEVEAFGYSIAYGNRSVANVKSSLKTHYKIPDLIMKGFDSDIQKSIETAKKDLYELT